MGELRESKKRETRQRISDIATQMFFARGFDLVTVEEIAAAANVSKVTVFNYFPRKEDLFLDREDELKHLLAQAVRERAQSESPIHALRRLVERLGEQKHPFARVDRHTVGWWRVVAKSPSLKARLREMGDEVVESLTVELAASKPDGNARLVAGLIVLTWRTAYGEGIRVIESGGSAKKANAAFIALIDEGFKAARAMTASSSRPPSARR
jgi:AcrR family transcriptional regulator